MTGKNQKIQDHFLNVLRKEKVPVTVYLLNGTRLRGTIRAFDNFCLLLKQNTQQLIYKHAISTIQPDKDINMNAGESAEN
jgi:host factor-I protein